MSVFHCFELERRDENLPKVFFRLSKGFTTSFCMAVVVFMNNVNDLLPPPLRLLSIPLQKLVALLNKFQEVFTNIIFSAVYLLQQGGLRFRIIVHLFSSDC
jgi:hypothetical protein